jgi:hypothetical protein
MKRILLALALLGAGISASQAESTQAQKFPSTNEERGCVLATQIITAQAIQGLCQDLIDSVKKHDGFPDCLRALTLARAERLDEAPSKRPAGFTLSMMKACSMMAWGISAERAEAITDDMCAKSHDPAFIIECRGAGYR